MAPALTKGAVQAIYAANEEDEAIENPVLQVLSVKKVSSAAGAADRYRLIISDGVNFIQAMLAVAANELVDGDNPLITKNTIVHLTSYTCNFLQARRILICLGLEFIENCDEKIGSPVTVEKKEEDVKPVVPAPKAKAVAKAPPASMAKKPVKPKAAGNTPPIYPIGSLSPYQNKWTIKARVTVKSDVRHWTNAKGEGKLFSVNLLDDSGEIKATGFGAECDALHPLFEEGKVYFVTKARVNIAKKQFSNLSSEYEIMFDKNTEVTPCEDDGDVPAVQYNFVSIASIAEVDPTSIVDILGVVTDHGSLDEITTKLAQKQLKKRELTVVDQSEQSIKVTLWGKQAESWAGEEAEIYAFKGCKVGDFGGRTLSLGAQASMSANPDIPEAHSLRGWYDQQGSTTRFTAFASTGGSSNAAFKAEDFRTIEMVKEERLGEQEDKPEYFNLRATVMFVKPVGFSYPACPGEKCSKKMAQENENEWKCEKCDKIYEAPEYRYLLNMNVSDYTDNVWLSGFNDIGELIIGKTAGEMVQHEVDQDGTFEKIFTGTASQVFDFSCRAKADTYQDVTRTRYSVMRAHKVDWVKASKEMLESIKQYE